MRILDRWQFEQLVAGGDILRSDDFGPKVYACRNQRMLKLFRRKRLVTLRANAAARFHRNAALLRRKGIKSIVVEALSYQPQIERQVAVYPRIAGVSLREALNAQWQPELLERLAAYLANLHLKGVYFRSIHFDNILLDTNGDFVLIDVLDMKLHHCRSLGYLARLRNFRHLLRYPEDIAFIERFGFERFWACYAAASGMPRGLSRRLGGWVRRRWF